MKWLCALALMFFAGATWAHDIGPEEVRVDRVGDRLQAASGSLCGAKLCAFPVSVIDEHDLDGWSDDVAATFTSALVDFAGDDDELALVVAHELSHNMLHHKAMLAAAHVHYGLFKGAGSTEHIRRAEQEADVLALYLMAQAGYDISIAPAFWARFGEKTGMGVFSDGTHLRTKARMALAERTIAQINAQRLRGEPPTPPNPLLK